MKPPRTYASPETFKQALEQRLKTSSKSGAHVARRRQLLVFDRFLARVVATVGETGSRAPSRVRGATRLDTSRSHR